jgi:hypothetical protein
LIIVEKLKENNYVCQEKSVFPAPITSILEQSGTTPLGQSRIFSARRMKVRQGINPKTKD